MSWFRYRSIKESRPRLVCRVCGHVNTRHADVSLNACGGCYRDSSSGELRPAQVVMAVVFLFSAYLFTGALGALAVVALVQFPLEISLGLDYPLAVGGLVGFSGGVWLAERLRSRELAIPAGQPVPAHVHPDKRIDKRVARAVIVAVLAFVMAWWLSRG